MDRIGLNYDFDNLSPELFRDFLRELQTTPYRWPNLYLAWEKQDGSLLMVGTNSSQMYQMIVHEINVDDWINKAHLKYGEALEYSSVLYGIDPHCGYQTNGKHYDPVEKLVEKVSACKYVGHWMDPDILMDDRHGLCKVLACGRWALAMQNIGVTESLINLEKLEKYLHKEMILEFASPEECMEHFNTYDGQNFASVDEMKSYQGEYGFGVGSKWYHICFDEALDVEERTSLVERLADATERSCDAAQNAADVRGQVLGVSENIDR